MKSNKRRRSLGGGGGWGCLHGVLCSTLLSGSAEKKENNSALLIQTGIRTCVDGKTRAPGKTILVRPREREHAVPFGLSNRCDIALDASRAKWAQMTSHFKHRYTKNHRCTLGLSCQQSERKRENRRHTHFTSLHFT